MSLEISIPMRHVILACLATATVVGCGPKSVSTTPTGRGTAAAPPAERSSVAVSAEELAEAFKTDRDAAKARYVGKPVVVEGKVHDVYGKEVGGEPTLVLWGYRDQPTAVPMLVECYFVKEQQDRLRQYKKDQRVQVRGVCTEAPALAAGNFVHLKECEFEP